MTLRDFVVKNTDRSPCVCGECVTSGRPVNGHIADMVFFNVSMVGKPDPEAFKSLIKSHVGEFCDVDVFDGNEHGYTKLGGWLGDQGIALQFMALGQLLGLWKVLTPKSVLGDSVDQSLSLQLAKSGLITISPK